MIMNGIKSFLKTRIGEKHLLEKNHLICSPAGEVTKTQSVDRWSIGTNKAATITEEEKGP